MNRLDTLAEAVKRYELAGVHDAAGLLPMMSDEEYEQLVASALANGWREPVIVTGENLLLDGRNRLVASIDPRLQLDVSIKVLNPPDPYEYVLCGNVDHRHLTAPQRAIVAARLLPRYRDEAKADMLAGKKAPTVKVREGGEATERAGRRVGVGESYVRHAAAIIDYPDLVAAVEAGEMKLPDAAAKAKEWRSIEAHADAIAQYPDLVEAVTAGRVKAAEAAKHAEERNRLAAEAAAEAEVDDEPEAESKDAEPEPEPGAEDEPTDDEPEPEPKKKAPSKKKAPKKPAVVLTPLPEPEPTTIELDAMTADKTRITVSVDKPKGKPTFNTTTEAVDWATWTWNPIQGCLHGCDYCYARSIATNSRTASAFPNGFDPIFRSDRLDAPANTKVPAEATDQPAKGRVFVGSMADVFGGWVPDEWIDAVFDACARNDQWRYLFLTKFPARYKRRSLPHHIWAGASVDRQQRVAATEKALRDLDVAVRWVSVEPMLEPITFNDLSWCDWVVIGAQTKWVQPKGRDTLPAFAPDFEWVAALVAQAREAGCAVYLKPNLLGRTDEEQHPGMRMPKETPEERQP